MRLLSSKKKSNETAHLDAAQIRERLGRKFDKIGRDDGLASGASSAAVPSAQLRTDATMEPAAPPGGAVPSTAPAPLAASADTPEPVPVPVADPEPIPVPVADSEQPPPPKRPFDLKRGTRNILGAVRKRLPARSLQKDTEAGNAQVEQAPHVRPKAEAPRAEHPENPKKSWLRWATRRDTGTDEAPDNRTADKPAPVADSAKEETGQKPRKSWLAWPKRRKRNSDEDAEATATETEPPTPAKTSLRRNGWRRKSAEAGERAGSDKTLPGDPPDSPGNDSGSPGPRGLRNILADSARMPPQMLVISFMASLLGLALPLAILQIYDRILPNQSYETLTLLTIGLIVAFTLEAGLKIFRSYLLGWHAVHHGFQSQVGAVSRLLTAPRSATGKVSSTLWMDAFGALGEMSAFEGGQSRLVLVDIPLAGVFLVVVGLVGGPLVLVPIALIAVFGILTFKNGAELQRSLINRSDQDNKQGDFLIECLSGIHTLKGLAIEPQMLRRFERLQKSSALASYDTIEHGNRLQAQGVLFANLMMVSIVTCGALFVMNGTMSIGELACCSLLSGRLTQPVLRGVGMWTEIQNVQLASERATRFDDLPETYEDSCEPIETPAIRGAITFDRVTFSHGGSDTAQIGDVSLDIGAGEFIGIRGEDGSGRSTFAGLATGALRPGQGSVTIDGIPAFAMRNQVLRHNIGYVSTNSAIFHGTVLENITMFRSGDDVELAREAARLIGLEDDINLLPDGYDTMLGLGGANVLSTGMLQRITIARALHTRPKILIFNEANSLMDFRSDALLREGMIKLKGTMTGILISNRPSFLNIADRVFELKDGAMILQQPSAPAANRNSVA